MRRSINQSLSALSSDVTYTSQLHSTQRCYGDESTVLGYHVTPCHGEDCVLDVPCTGYISYSGTVTAVTPGTQLALFADDTCIYATERHERRVFNKLQRGLTAVGSWCQRWNIKINEGKTQAIYFSRRPRMPEEISN
jgi:hypothetical protein